MLLNTREDYEELEPLVEYERYLARELPVLMRTRLEASILRASEPIESRLLSQIGDMLRDCQADLYRAYTTGVQCPLSETAADSPAIESPLTLDPHVEPAASSPDIPAFFAPPLLPSDVNYPFDALGSDFNESAPANQEPGTFSDSGFHSMITGSDQLVDFLEGYSEESLGQFISLDALLNESLAGTGPDEGQTTSTDEDMLLQNTEQI